MFPHLLHRVSRTPFGVRRTRSLALVARISRTPRLALVALGLAFVARVSRTPHLAFVARICCTMELWHSLHTQPAFVAPPVRICCTPSACVAPAVAFVARTPLLSTCCILSRTRHTHVRHCTSPSLHMFHSHITYHFASSS
jgi:hypothetical protein